jgi:hypothetical protein
VLALVSHRRTDRYSRSDQLIEQRSLHRIRDAGATDAQVQDVDGRFHAGSQSAMVHDRVDKIHKGAKSRRKGRLVVEYLPDAQAAFAYAFDAYIAIDNRGVPDT